jgi:hypothetical protein
MGSEVSVEIGSPIPVGALGLHAKDGKSRAFQKTEAPGSTVGITPPIITVFKGNDKNFSAIEIIYVVTFSFSGFD